MSDHGGNDRGGIPAELIVEEAGDPIFVVTCEEDTFRYAYVNEAYEAAVGKTAEEITGTTPVDLHGEGAGTAIENHYRHSVDQQTGISYDVELDGDSGPHHWEITLSPIVEDGTVTKLFGIAQEVTTRVLREAQVANQRDRLQVLNKVIRHDIRNEMMVARGYGDALAGFVDEGGQEYLEIVLEAVENTIDLTSRMRDLTEAMLREEIDPRPVDLQRTIEDSVDRLRDRHESAVITVAGPVGPESGTAGDVKVLADELLDTVVHNLLQNAIVHNDKPVPRIEVSIDLDDDTAIVTFADNGPGIPEDRKDALFGEGAKGPESPGTGLGLYLVKSIVDNYGGTIRVEDNDPEGCRFIVELRRPPAE